MSNIHPTAFLEKDVNLAEDVTIGPNCVIGKGTSIGEGTILHANAYIGPDVQIGKNNQFFPSCVVGTNPQILGLKNDSKVGKLIIGDNNTIREQVTIHPSMHPGKYTKIGNDNLLMVGVQCLRSVTFIVVSVCLLLERFVLVSVLVFYWCGFRFF